MKPKCVFESDTAELIEEKGKDLAHMPDAHAHSKPSDEFAERRRLFWQDVQTVMDTIWSTIHAAEAESHPLAIQEAEFDAARSRGESPDPVKVERVRAAQAAIVQRLARIETHLGTISTLFAEIRQTVDEVRFNECARQFRKQFGPGNLT